MDHLQNGGRAKGHCNSNLGQELYLRVIRQILVEFSLKWNGQVTLHV